MEGEPLRIGLVGLDSSHVLAFLRHFNGLPHSAEAVHGARIVGGYRGGSPEIEASRLRIGHFSQEAVDRYGITLFSSIEELGREVDALMILSVDGRQHLEQFRQTTALGKPVFIDKPLGGSLADACAIARLSRATGIPCFSSSSFRYLPDSPWKEVRGIGRVTAAFSYGPADREPHHPDLFWYGIHAVEALYTAIGPGCRTVARTMGDHADVVTGVWANGCVGTVIGNRNGYRGHGIAIVGTQGFVTGGTQHSYQPLAREILQFFHTRMSPVSLDTTVEIHAMMEAADESKRQGGSPVSIESVMVAASH
jgi:hypothetical protein